MPLPFLLAARRSYAALFLSACSAQLNDSKRPNATLKYILTNLRCSSPFQGPAITYSAVCSHLAPAQMAKALAEATRLLSASVTLPPSSRAALLYAAAACQAAHRARYGSGVSTQTVVKLTQLNTKWSEAFLLIPTTFAITCRPDYPSPLSLCM